MNTLPDKPSDLIELSLADLAQVEAQPEVYKVRMDNFVFTRQNPDICCVCLAGAVIVGTLRCNQFRILAPKNFSDPDVRKKLYAIDKFSRGQVQRALGFMGLSLPEPLSPHISIIEYELLQNRAKFRQQMQELANDLREHGL